MANRYGDQDYPRDFSDRYNRGSNYDYNRESDSSRNYGRDRTDFYEGTTRNYGYGGAYGAYGSDYYGNAYGGRQGNYGGTESGRGDYERDSYGSGESDYRYGRGSTGIRSSSAFERGFARNRGNQNQGEQRGWWDKTGDEISSWFGDEDAERRRQRDYAQQEMRGGHRGKGPRGYQPSDDRIKDNISDLLWDADDVDASDVEVQVQNGDVTLTGTVPSRHEKRRVEDIAEGVRGVKDVQNNVRVKKQNESESSTFNQSNTGMTTGTTATNTGTTSAGSSRTKTAGM